MGAYFAIVVAVSPRGDGMPPGCDRQAITRVSDCCGDQLPFHAN
jgi:hypothetical protein